MSANKSQKTSHVVYNVQYTSTKDRRDSPTSSILKTPTPIFLTTRNSSVKTRRLKFANSPDTGELLNDFWEGSNDSASTTSTGEISSVQKINYDNTVNERKLIEVALSPVKKMKVSPDSWNAFLEYQKYKDHSNETEKTDYTYSRLSKFRNKEIIPGFRIRPNLSRRPIRTSSSYESLITNWSPEANYCIKKTMYETTSSSAGKLNSNMVEHERNHQYQNEMSAFATMYDGDMNEGTMKFDDKYQTYNTFGDDGRILRSRKGFGYGSLSLDKNSHLGNQWGFDETDDDFITSTHLNEKSSSSYSTGVLGFLTVIYATIFGGISSSLTLFRDLFSRHILRRNPRQNHFQHAATSWKPWSQKNAYSYAKYNRGNQGKLSNWWYNSFLYALYSKLVSTVSSSSAYLRSRYYRSSRRGRFLWFLIPLLLLLALWLMRAESEDAFVSNKITAFKCKAHQYLSPARNQMNTVWRKASDYTERIFGISLEPFRYLFQFLTSSFAFAFNSLFSVFVNVLKAISNVLDFVKSSVTHFWRLFGNFLSDAASKKNNLSNSLYNFFSGIVLTVFDGLSFIFSSVGTLIFNGLDHFNFLFVESPHSEEKSQSLKLDFPGQDLSAHWDDLRSRIEALELELGKVKEEKNAGALLYQKKLEDNYKALQKYQLIVNEALRRQTSKSVHISKSSIQYFLDNATDELKKWILAHFMLKSETTNDIDENKFALLMAKYSNKSEEDLKMLQDEFSRFVRKYSAEMSSLKTDINIAQYKEFNGNDMSLSLVKKIISDEIKLHDADKTGKVDFALQSAGGQVLSVKCTKSFNHCFKYSNIFGVQVCAQSRRNAPEEAINPGMAPGQCWAFVGSQGFLTLELSHTIIVTGFTMEHISRLLSPNGRIESAPRKFSMWGLRSEHDLDPFQFGEYEYKDNDETYQYFPVANYSTQPFKIVELIIASNHGNPNYTCLYRIRVHGDIYPSHL